MTGLARETGLPRGVVAAVSTALLLKLLLLVALHAFRPQGVVYIDTGTYVCKEGFVVSLYDTTTVCEGIGNTIFLIIDMVLDNISSRILDI